MISAPIYCAQFIGRRAQLDVLLERFRATGESGSIVLVEGEAGLGKTRLLREFCRRLQSENAAVALTAFLEYADAPLAPFAAGVRALLERRPKALDAMPEAQRVLTRLLPELARGAGVQGGAEVDKIRLFAAVADALRRLGSDGGCALVIDDGHWADSASLELFQYLARLVASAKLLLVLAYRADDVGANASFRSALARLEREPTTWLVVLEPFDEGEMRKLMHASLVGRAHLSPQTLEVIRSAAGGNPLSAEELLKCAVETGVSRAGTIAVPVTLRDSIVDRLERFDDRERAVLLCAAAIGHRFEPEFLVQTLEQPFADVIGALRKAVALQLLVEEAGDIVRYVFRHAITREAIYDELLAIEARPLHARIAAALEEQDDPSNHLAELAYHYWAAGDQSSAFVTTSWREMQPLRFARTMTPLSPTSVLCKRARHFSCKPPKSRRSSLRRSKGEARERGHSSILEPP